MKISRYSKLNIIPTIACGLVLIMAKASPGIQPIGVSPSVVQDEGQQLFELGQYSAARTWLQQQLKLNQQRGDRLGEAGTLSNLALVYGELGQWDMAMKSIQASQALLVNRRDPGVQGLLAQVLNTYGQLQLQQGQAEPALETWKKASQLFQSQGNRTGDIRSRINQAQALQSLGFYRRSILVLSDINREIGQDPDTLEKVSSLRSLGEALRVAGDSEQAKQTIAKSLAIAQRLDQPEAIAKSFLTLGNIESTQGNHKTAQTHYQAALTTSQLPSTQINARLNKLRSQLELKQWTIAHQAWPSLLNALATFPPTSNTVQAQLNLASSLDRLRQASPQSSLTELTQAALLSQAQKNAQVLGDRRLESYAIGQLGHLYEQTGQYIYAKRLTQQALEIIDPQSSAEISYQWQWQLGRIEKAQGNTSEAIAAYETAVQLLSGLRQDLIAINTEIQFAFRDSVEPLHREFVSLLLSGPEPSSEALEKARQTIESLQLAELDNFFRSACLDITPVIVDEVDQSAVVIYPILLEDKMAIVVRLPGQPLKLYTTIVDKKRVDWVVDRLQLSLGQSNSFRFLELSQQLYQWLLGEAMADIRQSNVETLVFIPDGVLRNIPMGVLHNGDRFLVEDYALSLTPGLQLLQAGKRERDRSQVLVAGLTKARNNFPPLPYVQQEVLGINERLRNRSFLDEEFTQSTLEREIQNRPFPIIHLATHGQFSSDIQGTFLQAWDGEIDINQLRSVLRNSELRHRTSLELLVLSACETALGDRRAVLGLAGIAARSGAKTTLASLWKVNDQATAALMERFYQELSNPSVTKAKALQRAQQSILEHPTYGKHPYYWAAFVLVGSWQ